MFKNLFIKNIWITLWHAKSYWYDFGYKMTTHLLKTKDII